MLVTSTLCDLTNRMVLHMSMRTNLQSLSTVITITGYDLFTSIRTRGGSPKGIDPTHAYYVNNDSKFNDIPMLTAMRFLWNGIPTIDFLHKVGYILNNGLGSVVVDGSTLLECAQLRDIGGPLGNPSTVVAMAMRDQKIYNSHLLRKLKLFHCLLNYIDSRCRTYKIIMRHFGVEGPAAYAAVFYIGQLRVPPRIARAREDAWNQMDMEKLRIPFSMDGIFMWADAVLEQAEMLGKDGDAILEKFTSGFPSFFNVDAANMAKDTADPVIQYPATYGGDPEFVLAPNALAPHPFAGHVDLYKLIRKYLNQWAKKIAHVHRHAPSGMVKSAVFVDAEAYLNLLAKDVQPTTRCHTCNGEYHASTQVLSDGTVVECAKKTLDRMRNAGELKVVTDDVDDQDGFDMSEVSVALKSLQDEAVNAKAEIFELQQALAAASHKKPFHKRMSPKNKTQNTTFATEDTGEEFDDDDDDGSDASAHSTISNPQSLYANSTLQKRQFKRIGKKQ